MLIWILALVLLGIAGACGYKLGAVRFAVCLVGLLLGAALALPLGPYLKSLVPLVGLKNPVWTLILPPILVFLLIYLIFIGLSFFVHRKVEHYYKYQGDDVLRIRWERVNHAVGLWVGLMMGAVWLLLFGIAIYGVGYATVQMASDDNNSMPVRFLNQARQDLQSTGLDKAVAPFDPMPPRFYEASDILGLIYQNPTLHSRLAQYPPFLLLADRPEFQELAKNTEFNQLLLSKGDVVEVLKHPALQPILQSPDIIQELLNQDLNDLRTYLTTGVSPKYSEERILGKWKLDPYATMAQERKKHPDLTSTEMRQLRTVMTDIMPSVTLVATTDKKISLKAEGVSDKLKQLFQPPRPVVLQAPAAAQPGISPQMAQRYGLGGRRAQGPAAVVTAAPPPAKTNEIKYLVASAQGAWEHESDKYQIKAQDDKGKSETLQATADDERLVVVTPTVTLVFAKAD
jgi:hypothetical protein